MRRWDQDLEILRRLGVNAYRFSISWARASGGVRELAGLDHYQRVADSLLAAGIRPLAVLYHWDLPQALEEAGGLAEPGHGPALRRLRRLRLPALGDRIGMWVTHHDPWASAFHGYGSGSLAPGLRSEEAAVSASHVLLLSHALAVQACAPLRRPGSQFGVALGPFPGPAGHPRGRGGRLLGGLLPEPLVSWTPCCAGATRRSSCRSTPPGTRAGTCAPRTWTPWPPRGPISWG